MAQLSPSLLFFFFLAANIGFWGEGGLSQNADIDGNGMEVFCAEILTLPTLEGGEFRELEIREKFR